MTLPEELTILSMHSYSPQLLEDVERYGLVSTGKVVLQHLRWSVHSRFGFLYVREDFVVSAPLNQLAHLFVSDKVHHYGITCKHGVVGAVGWYTVVGQQG